LIKCCEIRLLDIPAAVEFDHCFGGKKETASQKEKCGLVVDFRRLNDVTLGDSYPLTLISDNLRALERRAIILLLI